MTKDPTAFPHRRTYAPRNFRAKALLAYLAALVSCAYAWAGDAILTGVVAHDGRAVAEAVVVARPLASSWEFHARRSQNLELAENLASTPEVRASTDDQGRYSLDLPPGVWTVRVTPAGYEPSCLVAFTSRQFREMPILELGGTPRSLRFVDAEGLPIGSARLRLQPATPPADFEWAPCDREIAADDQTGSVAFHASGNSVGFVFAPGFRELRLEEVRLRGPPRNVKLAPCPTRHREIRVTESGGAHGVADALLLGGEGAWPVGSSSQSGEIELENRGCFESFELLTTDARRLGSIRLSPGPAEDAPRQVIEIPPARRVQGRIVRFDEESNQVGIADAAIRSQSDPRLWATADDGYFELSHLSLAAPEENGMASLSVLAFAPGYLPELYELRVPAAPGEMPFLPLALFPLRPEATFTGQIVGPDGDPVPGARAELFSTPPGPMIAALSGESSSGSTYPPGISDLSGFFSVSAPPSTYDLLIRHPEYSPRIVPRLVAAHDGERRDLGSVQLARQWTLRGSLFDQEGDPVSGAEVAVLHRAVNAAGTTIRQSVDQTTGIAESRPDGSFSLSGIPVLEGQGIDIRAAKAGYRDAFLRNVRTPIDETVQLELRRNAVLQGMVYDLERRPVAGARVRADQSAPGLGYAEKPLDDSLSTTTDADGRFILPDLSPGPTRVEVTADDYLPARQRVELEPGARAGEEFLLEPAEELSGFVVDSEGSAVEDARVQAAGSRTLTDGDGSFVVSRVPVRDSVTVVAEKVDVGRAELTLAPGGGRDRIEITLMPSVVFRGRILGPDDQPVTAASVEISNRDGWGESYRQLTGRDGEFEFSTLDPGEYTLAVSHYGLYLPPDQNSVTVPDDSPAEIVLSSGGRIEGNVTGLDESERARAVIRASCGTGFLDETAAERDGTYQIEVPLGECLLSGRIAGRKQTSTARVYLTRNDPSVREDLHFVVDGQIRGRIDLDGTPLGDAGLSLITPTGILAATNRTDWRGEFEFPKSADGSYLMKVESSSLSLPAFFEVQVPSESPLILSIRTGRLTLDLADETGRAIDRARLILHPTEYSAYPPGMINRELRADGGSIYLPAIPAGSYLVYASSVGSVSLSLPLKISGGDDSTVSLTLEPLH